VKHSTLHAHSQEQSFDLSSQTAQTESQQVKPVKREVKQTLDIKLIDSDHVAEMLNRVSPKFMQDSPVENKRKSRKTALNRMSLSSFGEPIDFQDNSSLGSQLIHSLAKKRAPYMVNESSAIKCLSCANLQRELADTKLTVKHVQASLAHKEDYDVAQIATKRLLSQLRLNEKRLQA
jgi:hypothetical protein